MHERTCGELYLTVRGARAYLEHRFRLFEPPGEFDDSTISREIVGFAIHEVFIGTRLRVSAVSSCTPGTTAATTATWVCGLICS
jgi:DMSO reductase anchor subunit